MQLSDVVMVYFVIGAVMVGGGALALDPPSENGAGIVNFFVQSNSGEIQPTDNAASQLNNTGGAISSIVSLAVGVALLVWNLLKNLFVYLNWPVYVLLQANAPPMAVLLLGGSFTAAFYLGIVTMLRSSA